MPKKGVCSNCGYPYKISPRQIRRKKGKKIRCSRCGTVLILSL